MVLGKAIATYRSRALCFLLLCSQCVSQQVGNFETEEQPFITFKECTNAGGCTSRQAKLTLDANWRWIHSTSGYDNCYTGNAWDTSICTDGATCAQQCALEGVTAEKYENTYGVEQLSNGVRLNFVTEHEYGTNVGSRLYLMDGDDKYMMFYLKNREFTVDIDVSELYCGMNGAMYFIEMDEYGGRGLGNNNAGAKYGTGYCDAQCPHDIKFISGEANSEGWVPNPKDLSNNMGVGKYGTCCAEMDIWEANSMATAYTPHPCNLGFDGKEPQYKCEGIDCGDNDKGQRYMGVCDKDGCDINPYRMGNPMFYGRGPEYTVNTLKPMTVVTQFITDTGTDDGDLVEIKRFYVQDGNIIHSPSSTILGPQDTDVIDDEFCSAKKTLFEDVNDYQAKGGTKAMGDSLDRGQVAAFSLWDDVEVNMLWLDSAYPLDKPASDPGVQRGTCPGGTSSTPTFVRDNYPDGGVIFTNVAFGEIGSTTPFPSSPITPPVTNPTLAPVAAPTPQAKICKSWCSTNPAPWSKKCEWEKCNGCPSCNDSPISLPTASPLSSPVLSPTSPPISSHFCCTWDFFHCGLDTFCNANVINCQGSCGGVWMETSSPAMECIQKFHNCAKDEDHCCPGLSCVSNGGDYKQCIDDEFS